jgi:hypothetical protein
MIIAAVERIIPCLFDRMSLAPKPAAIATVQSAKKVKRIIGKSDRSLNKSTNPSAYAPVSRNSRTNLRDRCPGFLVSEELSIGLIVATRMAMIYLILA